MQYFNSDFLEFFKELAANNHKGWFDENRKRYEKEVKEPFKKFVGDLIEELKSKFEPELLIAPKDAIYRINRDIRFAKDKTPYKTNVSALISPRGRKAYSYAANYFELSPEHLGIYGGMYGGSTQDILAMRTHLANYMSKYEKIIGNKRFRDLYPEGIKGEAQKRLPKELKEMGDKYPVLYNKQFYYNATMDPEIIISDNLMNTVLEYCTASNDIKNFLREPFE